MSGAWPWFQETPSILDGLAVWKQLRKKKVSWFPAWAELEVLPPMQGWVRGPVPPIKTCHEADRTWAHPQEVPWIFKFAWLMIWSLRKKEKTHWRSHPSHPISTVTPSNAGHGQMSYFNINCWNQWWDLPNKLPESPKDSIHLYGASPSSALSRSTVNMESQPRRVGGCKKPLQSWDLGGPKILNPLVGHYFSHRNKNLGGIYPISTHLLWGDTVSISSTTYGAAGKTFEK